MIWWVWQDGLMINAEPTNVRVFVYGNPPQELLDALAQADIPVVDEVAGANFLVWNSWKVDELAAFLHPGIRWVQFPSAGINAWLNAGLITPDRMWLSASGAFAPAVALHAVASLLTGIHRIPEFAAATTWERLEYRPITQRKVAILGMGGIGVEIARHLKALGVEEIRGVVRTKRPLENADVVTTLDDPAWCEGVDDIINVLPATTVTRHVINAEVLAHLPADGTVVNVGRGEAIEDDAALAALENGALGALVLDVTDPEPLPDEHPYWSNPRVIITAHSANPSAMATPAFVDRALANVLAAQAGDSLVGVVDLEQGY